ncbi:conserved hypothetical protein [Theileria orientalis strain Shintoku]|uniref:Uncharacterized protein n=1 Tax=Theileria orientalis strain Shintoku TaxID=869250 RepID=J4C3B9_THEOR|nr:conserved hypothetical protein [Theileria orientalis strain Shintoku]BAM40171.1 conserved hypothetical protein [Theileria orientalis strain Shintoku]|eukprot:XP_009690472.1 conserved hypothetical protein [Theileria orientalis strain Shintoku]
MDNISQYLSYLGIKKKNDSQNNGENTSNRRTLAPLTKKLETDEYMSRVDVEDHIIPIWERETEVSPEKEEIEDVTLSYSYSLLSFVSKSITEGTVSSYESDEFELLSESDVEENDVRGVYLHDLQKGVGTDIPGPEVYQVYIKGVSVQGNVVECIDASPYSQQFPVILYEWFISTGYNSIERYSPEPVATGKSFKIPSQAIGKYIFCRAHRLVEPQMNSQNLFLNTGTYDPHINVYQNMYPNQKRFHNVSTLCTTGPVDISNELALRLLENLSQERSEDCTLCYNKDYSGSVTYEKSSLLNQTVGITLHISSKIVVEFTSHDRQKHKIFSLEKFENKTKNSEELEEKILFELDFSEILVQESHHSDTEILFGIYEEDKVKYYFSLKFEDRIQCLTALYTIYCMMAQQNTSFNKESWQELLNKGDLEYVVKVVREYLLSI